MTISLELEKLQTNLQNSYTSAANKGATLPTDQNFDNLSSTIDTITGGGSDKNLYGNDLGSEYIETLLNNDANQANDTIYTVLNGTTPGQHAGLTGTWEYKPQTYKEYLQNLLTGDHCVASNVLINVRDGEPEPDKYVVNPATLIGGKKYFVILEGGGGGSSTWEGGAGGYFVGILTPETTTNVTIKQGFGGEKAGAYSRRHNGKNGTESSVIGDGISIICPGGQGAIGLREGDETGNSSTYTYAPVITVTNGSYESIEQNVTMRPRRASWLTNSLGDTGAGGAAAPGTKKAGYDGFTGFAQVSKTNVIHITTNENDCTFTGNFKIKFGGYEKEFNITNSTGYFYVPSNQQVTEFTYIVSKTGFRTETDTIYVTNDTNISITMIRMTALQLTFNVIPDDIHVMDYTTYEEPVPVVSEDQLTYTYTFSDALTHTVYVNAMKSGYSGYNEQITVLGEQTEIQTQNITLEEYINTTITFNVKPTTVTVTDYNGGTTLTPDSISADGKTYVYTLSGNEMDYYGVAAHSDAYPAFDVDEYLSGTQSSLTGTFYKTNYTTTGSPSLSSYGNLKTSSTSTFAAVFPTLTNSIGTYIVQFRTPSSFQTSNYTDYLIGDAPEVWIYNGYLCTYDTQYRQGSHRLNTNTTYYLKVVIDGTTKSVYYSSNATDWVLDITITISFPDTSSFYLAGSSYQPSTRYYRGTIYLNNTKVYDGNGNLIWEWREPAVYDRNFTVIGNPNINDNTGIVSGFSTNNYLSMLEPFNPGNNSWEVVSKITTTSSSVSQQEAFFDVHTDQRGFRLGTAPTPNWELLVSNGTSWINVTTYYGSYTVLPNTTYWLKAGYDGTNYYLEYSLDGETFIRDVTYSGAVIGGGNTQELGLSWSGSIDLSETYIKINGNTWWEPYNS